MMIYILTKTNNETVETTRAFLSREKAAKAMHEDVLATFKANSLEELVGRTDLSLSCEECGYREEYTVDNNSVFFEKVEWEYEEILYNYTKEWRITEVEVE